MFLFFIVGGFDSRKEVGSVYDGMTTISVKVPVQSVGKRKRKALKKKLKSEPSVKRVKGALELMFDRLEDKVGSCLLDLRKGLERDFGKRFDKFERRMSRLEKRVLKIVKQQHEEDDEHEDIDERECKEYESSDTEHDVVAIKKVEDSDLDELSDDDDQDEEDDKEEDAKEEEKANEEEGDNQGDEEEDGNNEEEDKGEDEQKSEEKGEDEHSGEDKGEGKAEDEKNLEKDEDKRQLDEGWNDAS